MRLQASIGPSTTLKVPMKTKVTSIGFIVPEIKDLSWNFIKKVLTGEKALTKPKEGDHSAIIIPPK